MAREHAPVRLDIWNDDDFRALSEQAQLLYFQLLTSVTLNYAGVADWRPRRLAVLSAGATPAGKEAAVGELVEKLLVVVDEDTEEVLVRSFLKHDGLLNKPNVSKAMVRHFAEVASATLRGVIVHELRRLHARHPEWRGFELGEVRELLERGSVDPSELLEKGSGKGSGKGSEINASLPTPYSLLPAPDSTLPPPSANEVRADVEELCTLLVDLMIGNGDNPPTITDRWRTSARLMLDKDGRTLEAASRLMRWALADSFWQPNIRSMPTFREKFDQLRGAANRQREQRKQTPMERAAQTAALGRPQLATELMEVES